MSFIKIKQKRKKIHQCKERNFKPRTLNLYIKFNSNNSEENLEIMENFFNMKLHLRDKEFYKTPWKLEEGNEVSQSTRAT